MRVKKSVVHPELDDTVQRWYNWQHEMKKRDEDKRKEEEHQKLVSRMITGAETQRRTFFTVLIFDTSAFPCL